MSSKQSTVVFINPDDTSRHTSSANAAIYPNLGLLTLMSSLRSERGDELALVYMDGTAIGNSRIRQYLTDEAQSIAVVCITALTSNYGAGLEFCRIAKRLNTTCLTIIGNDHFSALFDRVLAHRPEIDFGFYGNDVVEGFTKFVSDALRGDLDEMASYAGLVYRDDDGSVKRNSEDPSEYSRLPMIDYSLMDSPIPHNAKYLADQKNTYFFMRERELRSQVIDIGRGCIKFAGPRTLEQIPINACDFCGIIPGVKEIISPDAERAWNIIRNAFEQGYNYLYVTADELPLTLWPMLKSMIDHIPDWYDDLEPGEKPRMFGYMRAEAFSTHPERMVALMEKLNFDHFFIGFDGMSDISLKVMNKQAAGGRGRNINPMQQNLDALDGMVNKGGLVTAGLVITHLGITRDIMESNYHALEAIIDSHPRTFAAIDFGPLCPIPGSQSFSYLTDPQLAERRAASFGLAVDRKYLESRQNYYLTEDVFDMDEMIQDFILGCCPDVDEHFVSRHMEKIAALAEKHSIVVGGGV